jgi:hypothetical protein
MRVHLLGLAWLCVLGGCAAGAADDAADPGRDAASADASSVDGTPGDPDAAPGGPDAAPLDAAPLDAAPLDAAPIAPDAAPSPDAAPGVIGGGPCLSGAAGATAYRIRWANGGGTAYPVYEVHGLPDGTRNRAGAYGYQIGYTPRFVDPFLGEGGLQLDGSGFVDLELSTIGVAQVTSATLSIYGRSFHTTASGSFHWQSFTGSGTTPSNFVSNVAPYQWYSAPLAGALTASDGNVLLRIKAGPSSGTLVVHRIEICMEAS